ncbi:MAG: tetratricopeptide repeat protein [Bacteroidia bacterium]|nr:tetratricopeptide repeat protein [Bacteroidia bacterium]
MAKKGKAISQTPRGSLFRQYRTICLTLAATAFFLYFNTLGHEYAFDDSVAITANEFTKKGVQGIPDLMTKDLFAGIYGQGLEIGGGRWRPLSLVTYAIEWEIMGGPSPGLSHFINVLLYSVCIVMLFLALIRLTEHPLLALMTSVLFLVHPLHSEVVANIKSRDEIFSLLFILASVWYLLSDRAGVQWKAASFFALALLSKENGILFLLFFPFLLFLIRKLPVRDALKRSLPLLITGLVYLIIRSVLVGTVGDKSTADLMENHLFGTGFGERTASVALIFWEYLCLFFFPHPLSSDYSFNQIPVVGWADYRAILSFVVHGALLVIAVLILKRSPRERNSGITLSDMIAFGILFYLIQLSLVSNLLFNVGAPLGERFTFTASLGACLAVCALVLWLLKTSIKEAEWKSKPMLIILLLSVPLALKTFSRNPDWKNNLTLFAADIHHAPNSAKVHFYLGNSLYNAAMDNKGLPEYKEQLLASRGPLHRATQIHPGFHHAWNKLGTVYAELKMPDSAIVCLETALAAVPENINLKSGEKDKVLSMDRTGVDALATLGSVYGEQKGDFTKAIYYLNESLRFNPNNFPALQNLGIAYAMKGDTPNAIAAFERAAALDPNNGQTYLNLGKLYGNSGDMKRANMYFEKAKSLGVEVR